MADANVADQPGTDENIPQAGRRAAEVIAHCAFHGSGPVIGEAFHCRSDAQVGQILDQATRAFARLVEIVIQESKKQEFQVRGLLVA